jgi:DNA/RNA-binding domain of Phe-tRNA-synthetase-like protein
MRFQHHEEIWRDFPSLVPGVILAEGISLAPDVSIPVARFTAVAQSRLEQATESEFAEIQSWRRAFTRMGLKPTQYRCAAESLLRRLRTQGSLPGLHPLVDLCNAVSLAFAIPVAVLDVSAIAGDLQVRYAAGDEEYLTFSGETEHPAAGEVIFRDDSGQAHARRWTNRQSGLSAVRASTTTALIVAEALHDSAPADIERLTAAIAGELDTTWSVKAPPVILTATAPCAEF